MPDRIEQALYGYRDGHRRLAGSAEPLEPSAEQTMLVLSDLAAPGAKSFDAYLTGFPLPGASRYVLARTWPADEIHRPGAVWTHALLIPFARLAHIDDPGDMLAAFRRPSHNDPEGLNFYRTPASLDSDSQQTAKLIDHGALQSTLAALYQAPHAPVVVPGLANPDADQLVMTLWRQQWPRLRRRFSFCTWTTIARRINSRSMDLYITPAGTARSLLRDLGEAVMADQKTPIHEWVETLTADALSHQPTELRDFLWRYAADVDAARQAMRPLLDVRETLRRHDRPTVSDLSNLAGLICSSFPDSGDAVSLKRALFGPPDDRTHGSDDDDVLLALVEHPPPCLDPKSLEVQRRSKGMWASPPNHVRRLLLASTDRDAASSALTVAIVQGLASTASATELRLLHSEPALVGVLANARIDLLRIPAAWPEMGEEQERLLAVIDASHNPELQQHVVEGTWTTARDELVEALDDRIGPEEVVAAVIETGESRGWSRSAPSWMQQLSEHSEITVSLLSDRPAISPKTAAALAGQLDPLDPAVRSLDCAFWMPLIEQPQTDSRTSISAATFAFAVGLRCSGDPSERLLAWAFPTVHAAALRERLPATRWRWLDPQLPSGKPWNRWDRAERLRRFIAHSIVEQRWRSDSIIMALPDPELFIEVTWRIRRIPGSGEVLRDLTKHLNHSPTHAHHAHLLRSVLDRD